MTAPAQTDVPTRTDAPLQAEAHVDLDAVRSNVQVLRERAGAAAVMAVVKADGYGHGMLACARAALDAGAGWLGVATLDEALTLREAGIQAPVLAWLLAPGQPLAAAIAAGIDLSVAATWMLDEVVAAAHETGLPARVHLKIDTGLGRNGATAADWPDLLEQTARAQAERAVEVVGIWSHLAYADEPGHATVAAQRRAFDEALAVAAAYGVHPHVRHLANSAATLTTPAAAYDLVRPGIAVYGVSPGPAVGTSRELGLRPAMTLRARVALVKRVPGGQGVSYGHRYRTAGPTTLALVPLGYADGIPRNATNTAEMQLGGRRRRIAGTVCMDQLVLDVGEDPVRPGDDVVVFGPGDDGEPTAQDWADRLGTIGYEIVTRVGARVPRTYSGAA